MLANLKAWEANLSEAAPKLLIVSSGSVEANQALGLRSPIVLDQIFAARNEFEVDGTPQAVLVDAQGNIASEVAAGAPAVMALAKRSNRSNGVQVLPQGLKVGVPAPEVELPDLTGNIIKLADFRGKSTLVLF